MELDYMQRLRWWLKTADAWPSKVLGEKVRKCRLLHHKLLFVFWSFCMFSQLAYIRRYQRSISFFHLGHCYVTLIMNIVCVQRVTLVMTKPYKMLTKAFVKEFHLFHHRNSTDFAFKTYKEVNKYCRIATIVLQIQTISAPLMFNAMPIIANVSSGMFSNNGDRPVNGTYEHSVYYVLPFDCTTKLSNYVIVAIANYILCCWVGVSFCIFDLYLSLLVCHIWGHLKILEHELRHFIRPSAEHFAWYSLTESEEVEQRVKMLINHHRQIMNFVRECSAAFGLNLALYFSFHQICCCILLLECSKMDTESLIKFGPLTLITFQSLIQISIIFEFIGAKSEGLADAVYSLPWECMGVRERRLVLFFLCNAQDPIHIKALGLVPVGVKTMTAIIRTSLSYFILLRTAANN